MRLFPAAWLLSTSLALGCATARPNVRVLDSQVPTAPVPELSPSRPDAAALEAPPHAAPSPRIGAPGGSGAGSRRVPTG